MRVLSRSACAVVTAALLSACSHGAGGQSAVPIPLDNARSVESASPTTAGTLYVSSAKAVYAYDVTGHGQISPQRTLTPLASDQYRNVAIATEADGNLGVLQEYYPSTGGHKCRLVIESATASGTAGILHNYDCTEQYDNAYGYGVSANNAPASASTDVPLGDAFDVLYHDDAQSAQYVRHIDENGTSLGLLTVSAAMRAIAGNPNGLSFIDDTSGNVSKYAPDASDPSTRLTTFSTPQASSGPIVTSQNTSTVYVATTDNSGNAVVDGFRPTSGTYSSTPSVVVGPFANFNVTALAVDKQGLLYVGLSAIYGHGAAQANTVKVYDVSTASPTVVRAIALPVPGNPSDITGLAIAQSPFAAEATTPSPIAGPIVFNGYSNGPVRQQNGWQSNSCGGNDYDANVVQTSSYPSAQWTGTPPTKALQVDNAVTQGCFSGLGTPLTLKTAGIVTALTNPSTAAMCGPDCKPYFTTQFVVTSATGGFQPALEMSISPVWNNDGARMQYIGLWHTQDANSNNKLLVFTNDVEDVIGASPPCFQCADFVPYELAYVDPTQPHTIGMTMSFVAPDKDVVQFYVDGQLAGIQKQQFRSWEDYYLYDTESDPGYTEPYSRAVNDLLFHPGNVDTCNNFADYASNCNQRSSGPSHTDTAGNGFLFTNITTCAGSMGACSGAIQTAAGATAPGRSASFAARTMQQVHRVPRLMSQLR